MPASTAEASPRLPGVWLLAAGVATLTVCWILALPASVSTLEEEAFRSVNEWPDWLETPAWPVMQLGAIAVVPLIALLVYLWWRRWAVAGAVLGSGFVAWILAKVVKEFVERGRPQALLDDVILRPEWSGLGFVSGHAAVAFAMATIVSPLLRGPGRVVLWVAVTIAGILRLYTAAHLPLDVLGGAGLGVAVGGLLRVLAPGITSPRGPTG